MADGGPGEAPDTGRGAAEALALRVLARPPRPPRRPALFTSGSLFGEPGIYPGGPAMAPATGPPPDGPPLALRVGEVLDALGAPAGEAHRRLQAPADPGLPGDPALRLALAVLARTAAAPAAAGFPGRTTARSLRFGSPASPGRVVGPPDGGGDPGDRVVNQRYRAEHPALLVPSLAHDLLWSPETAGHAAETLLHALSAIVHLQLVARSPGLAHLGTELCRRQNSLAITLCNSRRPGAARSTLVAPDGPGTIPGGAPGMQTPDFWSVPFAPVGDAPAPALAVDVLAPLIGPEGVEPLVGPEGEGPGGDAPAPAFSEAYGRWLGTRLGWAWLPPVERLRAVVALGLVDGDEIAGEAAAAGYRSREAVIAGLGLEAALAVWSDDGAGSGSGTGVGGGPPG